MKAALFLVRSSGFWCLHVEVGDIELETSSTDDLIGTPFFVGYLDAWQDGVVFVVFWHWLMEL